MKNNSGYISNKKKKKEMLTENPFVLAISILLLAYSINFLLETSVIKNLFNWLGYYINYGLYSLNLNAQTAFENHPFIHVPPITNPFSAEVMAAINPWMWLRGFIVSSFVVGQVVTILQIKPIDAGNVAKASLLTGLFQLCLYAAPYGAGLSLPLFLLLVQKYIIGIISLIVICFFLLLFGVEYALFLYRNEKIQIEKIKNGPNIAVKYTDKFDW